MSLLHLDGRIEDCGREATFLRGDAIGVVIDAQSDAMRDRSSRRVDCTRL
jgi:hypothetical protein